MPVHDWGLGAGPGQPDPSLLERHGPVIPAQIEIPTVLAQQMQRAGAPVPQPVTGNALIDTGATLSAVDAQVLTSLGIASTGIVPVWTPSGPTRQPVFASKVAIPAMRLVVEIPRVLGAQLQGAGIIALLGRDFLRHTLFEYNGTLGILTLAY